MGIKSCKGMTIVEMMIALTVGSIVVSGAYQANNYFTKSAYREKEKALLEGDLIATCEVLEKDLRMSGYGLPWNGLRFVINSDGNDEMLIFRNMKNEQTVLAKSCDTWDDVLYVKDASAASVDKWISISTPYNNTVRKIKSVGINPSGDDTICLYVACADAYPAGKNVYFASRSRYFVKYDDFGKKPSLVRRDDTKEIPVGPSIDTLDCRPMDSTGTFLSYNFITAEKVKVTLGGKVGSGTNVKTFLHTTEVNIRNGI